MERARRLGYREIRGEYIPTRKNALVGELYDRMGFRRVRVGVDRSVLYAPDVAAAAPPTAYLRPKETAVLVGSA